MIPFASVACLIDAGGQTLEVSLMDLSAVGFTFRVPHRWTGLIDARAAQITLRFHRFRDSGSCVLTPDLFTLTREETAASFVVYRLETVDLTFRTQARCFMAAYEQYVDLKCAGDDARLSEALVGYPVEIEEQFPASFTAQRRGWLAGVQPDAEWRSVLSRTAELAISLSSPETWAPYLALPADEFAAWYWADRGLEAHPLTERRVDCLYIGNQFCPLLFPDEATLDRLLDKAAREHLRPVLALSTISESRLAPTLAMLERLVPWCEAHGPLELIVNDWGLAEKMRGDRHFTRTLGLLLCKRRKDVRMDYMQGFEGRQDLLGENALSAGFFRDELEGTFGISRLSHEACGYPARPVSQAGALHLPFYQMNTAGHCTLYARCRNGSRAAQQAVTACPHYCAEHAFLYPEALRMVGRYNSLFGFDAGSLTDGAYLTSLMPSGVDRLVIDLL